MGLFGSVGFLVIKKHDAFLCCQDFFFHVSLFLDRFFLFLLNRGKELSPQEPQSSNGGRLTDRVTYCHVVPSMHSTTHCRGHTTSSLLAQRDRPPDIPSPFPMFVLFCPTEPALFYMNAAKTGKIQYIHYVRIG